MSRTRQAARLQAGWQVTGGESRVAELADRRQPMSAGGFSPVIVASRRVLRHRRMRRYGSQIQLLLFFVTIYESMKTVCVSLVM